MLDLTYRPAALADLDAIYDFIAPDNPRRAASFVQDIRARCQVLREHPMLGPARDEIRSGLRILPMLNKVVVCYRITGAAIDVVRVLYGDRDFETIMMESDD